MEMSELNTNFTISPVDDCCWMNDNCSIYIEGDDAISAKAFVDYFDRLTQENQQLREALSDLYEVFYGEYSSGALTYKQDMAMLATKKLLSQLEAKDE